MECEQEIILVSYDYGMKFQLISFVIMQIQLSPHKVQAQSGFHIIKVESLENGMVIQNLSLIGKMMDMK